VRPLRRRRRRAGRGRPLRIVSWLPAPGRGSRVRVPRAARRARLDARLPGAPTGSAREPKPSLSVLHCPGVPSCHCLEHQRGARRGDHHGPARRLRPVRRGGWLTRHPLGPRRRWRGTGTAMAGRIALPSEADHSGREMGADDLGLLRDVIDSGTLNCTKGTQVKAFERAFAERHGLPHARAVTSGTAACHVAIAAIDPEPGDEIITTPITDMGAIAPILFQQAIPVFADVDPVSLNVTPATLPTRITRPPPPISPTHRSGNPCNVGVIKAIADAYGIPVIEDCAQAFLAQEGGRLVGTIGTIGAFSLQQGKHMTTGEGGVVITADPAHARRMTLFSAKRWGYGDPEPDHEFLALNYRMTDLQGAVARAQLTKLDGVVARRR